jgi:hypothetical protein
MHRSVAAFLMLLVAAPAFSSGFVEDILFTGQVVPYYGKAKAPEQKAVLDSLQRAQVAEGFAQLVQGSVRLKHRLNLGFTSCGKADAFYDSKRSTIVVCSELVELITKQVMAAKDRDGTSTSLPAQTMINGAVLGIMVHQLGHAIIDIDRIAITGSEEEVADQFTVYFATHVLDQRRVPMLFPTVWFWRSLVKNHDVGPQDLEMIRDTIASDHAWVTQRSNSVACWALGSSPRTGEAVADYMALPLTRRSRCAAEYWRIDDDVRRDFGKFLDIKPA